MNNSQVAVKLNPPIWLKILVISLIGLGIFFRFADLGHKLYWGDECFTSLAISGHTLTEIKQEVFNRQEVFPITTLDKYQQIDSERGVADTLRYLITSDPQHPPLYYETVRLWAQVFGDSPGKVRILSAIFSLLILPSVYWLCLELWESPIVGWLAMAIIAVSPLQIFFAEEARQYSLWMVTILLSSAALLRAIRKEDKYSWALYSFTLVLGLYTHLFTGLVAIAHSVYVVITRYRFPKSLLNYLLSVTAAGLLFLPWIIVLLAHLNTAVQLTQGWTLKLIDNPWEQIGIFLVRVTRIFFDFNLAEDNFWVNSLAVEGSLPYILFTLIFIVSLISYSIYFLARIDRGNASLFICLLGGLTGGALLIYDLTFGGILSIQIRYLLPLCLSLEILIAYIISFHIWQEKTWRQKVWQLIVVGLIIAGLVSDPKIFKAESWWPQAEGTYILEVARVVNQTEKPLLIINNSSMSVGTTLALSHRLEPKVQVLSLADDGIQGIPQGYSKIFLLHSNNSLFHQLEEDKTYSLTYSLQLLGADGGFWRFEKLPSRT